MEATLTTPNANVSSSPPASAAPTSRAGAGVWIGRILSGLVTLFLVVDAAGKILRLAPYVEGTARVGYPASSLVPLGVVLLASTILYALPRTARVGALLLTGYLGGATATHVRMGEPFVFAVVFGVLVWLSLALRDRRVADFFVAK